MKNKLPYYIFSIVCSLLVVLLFPKCMLAATNSQVSLDDLEKQSFTAKANIETFKPGEAIQLEVSNTSNKSEQLVIAHSQNVTFNEKRTLESNDGKLDKKAVALKTNGDLSISLSNKQQVTLFFETNSLSFEDATFKISLDDFVKTIKVAVNLTQIDSTLSLEKKEGINWQPIPQMNNKLNLLPKALEIDDGATWESGNLEQNIHGHFERTVKDTEGNEHLLKYGYGFESSNSENVRIKDWRKSLASNARPVGPPDDYKLNMNRPNFYLEDDGKLITSLQQEPGLKDYNLIDTYPLVLRINGVSSRLDGKKNNDTRIPALYKGEYEGRTAVKSVTDCRVNLGNSKYVDLRVTTEVIPLTLNTIQYRYFVTNTTEEALSMVATKADRYQMNNFDRNVPSFSRGDGTGFYTLTEATTPLHRLDYSLATDDSDDYFLDNYGPDNWRPSIGQTHADMDDTGADILNYYFDNDVNASGAEAEDIAYQEDERFPPVLEDHNPTHLAMKWNEVTLQPGETQAFAYNVGLRRGSIYPDSIQLSKEYQNITKPEDGLNHGYDQIEYTISASNLEDTARKGYRDLSITDVLPDELEKPTEITAIYGPNETDKVKLKVDDVYQNHTVSYNFGKTHFIKEKDVYQLKIKTRIKANVKNTTVENTATAKAYTGKEFDKEITGTASVKFDVAEPQQSKIITKYVDENDKDIATATEEMVKFGESYETEPIKVKGYVLDETKLPENAKGNADQPEIIVVYHYKKGTVQLVSVPDVNFGTQVLPNKNTRYRLDRTEGLSKELIIKDLSANSLEWSLFLQQTTPFKDNKSGVEWVNFMELNGKNLQEQVLITNNNPSLPTDTLNLTDFLTNSEDQSDKTKGLILPSQAYSGLDDGEYQSTLTWNLSVVPSHAMGGR